MQKEKNFSDKTINRLTLYHCILSDYMRNGIEAISSFQIAALLKIDDSQVRRDISGLGNVEKCRSGYLVKSVRKSIEDTLGFEKPKNAFIIGAGNLGFALAKYNNFLNYGLNVLALFDNDPLKLNMSINDKKIYHISKLPEFVDEMNVDIAILTVPFDFAQETVDFLVKSGIKYIWNFTPVVLSVPDGIQVWNENLMGNFLTFTYKKENI
jgi:redox-sensing transcriptional repressor